MRRLSKLLILFALLVSYAIPTTVHANTMDVSFANGPATAVYNYTGGVQQYNVPAGTEFLKVRLWGAAGSPAVRYDNLLEGTPGYGGYTEAIVDVRDIKTLYVYVGSDGLRSASFNGGGAGAPAEIGYGTPGNYYWSGSGGGATDIRLTSGVWDSGPSLESRIMVSGGGAGGGYVYWSYKDGWSSGPHGSAARDVFMGSSDQTFSVGKGEAGSKGNTYNIDSTRTYAGGGGGWLGGTRGNAGTNYVDHDRVFAAIQAYSINAAKGRAEITPLVGGASEILKSNYQINIEATPSAGIQLDRFPGDVVVTGNNVGGRFLRYNLSGKNVTVRSPQVLSLYGSSKNLILEDSLVAINKPIAVSEVLSAQKATITGSGATIIANSANFTGCAFPSTAVSLKTVNDITFSGTINYGYGGLVCNGLTMLHTNIGISQTDAGINNILLNGLYTNYMNSPSSPKNGGTIPMHLVLERQIQGSNVWERQDQKSVNLLETTSLRDLGTIIKTDILYRIGYKKSTETGYVVVQDNFVTGNSPGSVSLDETPPVISYFQVGTGVSSVKTSSLPTTVMAADGRTTNAKLKMQFRVGAKQYIYNTTSKLFQLAGEDDWGPFVEKCEGLPLESGSNHIVVFIKDESGNKSSAAANVISLVDGELSPLPNISNETAVDAISITTPLTPGGTGIELINGTSTYIVSSNMISLVFDAAKLPANISAVKYSISGDNYSEEMTIFEPVMVQLPPLSGTHMIKVNFINREGLPSAKATPIYVAFDKTAPIVRAKVSNGSTVTRSANVDVDLTITDDVSSNFTWSNNLVNWSTVPENRIISLPLNLGRNNCKIFIKDSSGKSSVAEVSIWRIQ